MVKVRITEQITSLEITYRDNPQKCEYLVAEKTRLGKEKYSCNAPVPSKRKPLLTVCGNPEHTTCYGYRMAKGQLGFDI